MRICDNAYILLENPITFGSVTPFIQCAGRMALLWVKTRHLFSIFATAICVIDSFRQSRVARLTEISAKDRYWLIVWYCVDCRSLIIFLLFGLCFYLTRLTHLVIMFGCSLIHQYPMWLNGCSYYISAMFRHYSKLIGPGEWGSAC